MALAEKPKVPKFIQGLQGGEVSEGQRYKCISNNLQLMQTM